MRSYTTAREIFMSYTASRATDPLQVSLLQKTQDTKNKTLKISDFLNTKDFRRAEVVPNIFAKQTQSLLHNYLFP